MNRDGMEIRLEIHGKEMEEGYNLYYLNKTFSNLQSVLDKAYLTYFPRKKQMVDSDREVFQVRVTSFQSGSMISNMMIFLMAANQASLFGGVPFTPQAIWTLFQQAYEYLVFVLSALEGEQDFQIYEGDNGMNVIVNGNNNKINVYPQAQELAKNAVSDIYKLSNTIDEYGGIDKITVTDYNLGTKPITFDKESKNLFKTKKRLLPQPAMIAAQIFRLDGHALTGRLKVINSSDPHIQEGKDYSFAIEEEYILENCTEAFMKTATITALKEMVFSPLDLEDSLNRLKIIEVLI